MKNRFVAATAATFLMPAGLLGCSIDDRESLLGKHTAQVRINGSDVGDLPISCSQVQWRWTIETLRDTPGFTVQLSTEGKSVTPESVKLRNLGGFTGSFWENLDLRAEAGIADSTFTVTGTATGFYADNPTETATADFMIRTDC